MKFWIIKLSLLLTNFCLNAKVALIFGITGQDGSYLSQLLLQKGYTVHGVVRRTSHSSISCLYKFLAAENLKSLHLHDGDITDISSILSILHTTNPDEVYNLAAQSDVRFSFEAPETTAEINALGVLRILEAIIKSGKSNTTRFYQASSSEMFGDAHGLLQNEATSLNPRSPYGIAKQYAHSLTKHYRDRFGIFAATGILFNHESPLRGEMFVTRKISRAVAEYKQGNKNVLHLGNLDAKRDWGYAKDYVKAMWMMLQQEKADDFVIATGHVHTVRQFVETAFQEIGIQIRWDGTGANEKGFNESNGDVLVAIDPIYFRPTEINITQGDFSKAKQILGWQPETSFSELVKIMVEADIRRASCIK